MNLSCEDGMHFLILGGNGRTGSLVVEYALSRGHTVTALVRDPSKLPERQDLTILKGSPTNVIDVTAAFSKQTPDVVLVTLNAPRTSDSPFAKSIAPPRLMTDSIGNAVSAMKKFGTKRIVIMQAFGVGSSFMNNNFLVRWMFSHTEMSKQYADHNMVDIEVGEASRDGSFSWTMVRPCMLKGEEAKAVSVMGDEGKGAGFLPSISRQSVARFLVEDCAESSSYVNNTPVICN